MKFALGTALGFVLGIAVSMLGLKGRFPPQSRSLVYAGDKTLKKDGPPNVDFFKIAELDDVYLMCSRDQMGINFAIARKGGAFPSAIMHVDNDGPVQIAAINDLTSNVTVTRTKSGHGPFDKLTISTPQGGDLRKVLEDSGIDGTYDKTKTVGNVPKPK